MQRREVWEEKEVDTEGGKEEEIDWKEGAEREYWASGRSGMEKKN